MTTNTPAPAHEAVLTDDEILDAIAVSANFDELDRAAWSPESLALGRAIESALLSKLRAPVADPRTVSKARNAFETWSQDTNQGYDLAPVHSGKMATYESDKTEHAWRGFCHGRLASAPVAAPAMKLVTPPSWPGSDEEYAAAVGRGEVGGFHMIGTTHAAPQASAPVAGEAQPGKAVGWLRRVERNFETDYDLNRAVYDLPPGMYDLYAAPRNAAPQASEAVRVQQLEAARIAYAREFLPDENGDPDVGNIHANIRKLKAQLAALSAQPGAQKGDR